MSASRLIARHLDTLQVQLVTKENQTVATKNVQEQALYNKEMKKITKGQNYPNTLSIPEQGIWCGDEEKKSIVSG